MEEVVVAGVDGEHLRSARDDGLAEPGRRASFGTNFWSETPSERLEALPTNVPIYFYVVTRGLEESIPYAQWSGTFVAYRAGPLSESEWAETRPRSARERRSGELPVDEQEPDWAGYLMVSDLRELPDRGIPLSHFRVNGRPLTASVVRHPMLAGLDV